MSKAAANETASARKSPLYAIGIQIENFKRIESASLQFDPKGGLIQVTGANGQGKSTLIDAFLAALRWRDFAPKKAIRQGAEKATVTLELGAKTVELIVELSITEKGRDLKVMAPDGSAFGSPQAVLDAILGKMVDPVAFLNMRPAEQVEFLLNVSGKRPEIERLRAEEKAAYDRRTPANSEVTRLEKLIGSMIPPSSDDPDKPVSIESLQKRHKAASDERLRRESMAGEIKGKRTAIANLERETEGIDRQIAELNERKASIQKSINAHKGQLSKLESESASESKGEDPDAIMSEIASLQKTNARVEEVKRYNAIYRELAEARKSAKALDDEVAAKRKAQSDLLNGLKLPVDGLAFNDDGVTYHGTPLADCSTAERIRVAIALGVAEKPDLRFMIVKHGNDFDPANLELIASLAEKHGIELLMERVDASGLIGIAMEDGRVVARDGVKVPASGAEEEAPKAPAKKAKK